VTAQHPLAVPGRHPTVCLVDSVPCYRHGLTRAFEDEGCRVIEPSAARRMRRIGQVDGAVVTLNSHGDWELIAELNREGVVVVVLLADPDRQRSRRALRAGAYTVVDWRASPPEVVGSLMAAMEGKAILSVSILRSIVLDDEPGQGGPLTDAEVGWLQALASGWTVARLATRANYSEREMYRRLRRVYGQLGASGRVAAIAKAVELGILR
jgi:DNA-binding NarL/FixJ family response regulator